MSISERQAKKFKKQVRYGRKAFSLSEEDMREKESKIPQQGMMAVKCAYKKALRSGYSVMQADGDKVLEVFPDGSRSVVKVIEPPFSVKNGQKLRLSTVWSAKA